MAKKENESAAANKSLLQTVRSKNFGSGKFALLSNKSKPQPPVKKVKIPAPLSDNANAANGKLYDDKSKVSDITESLEDKKPLPQMPNVAGVRVTSQNAKSNEDACEVESSVLSMSISSENSFDFSVTKAFVQREITETGNKEEQVTSKTVTFFSLWPTSAKLQNGSNDKTEHQLRSKKFAKSSLPQGGDAVLKKKTMDISKGLKFSAPAPMTLNRCQPQMGQEKTAPESKEYVARQKTKELEEQEDFEARQMAEARRVVEGRLFNSEHNNVIGEIGPKKSLVKKILGKVRPKSSSEKWQLSKEKSSAIEAAMAAAAAAVDAATTRHDSGENEPLSEERARAIANQALLASKQKHKNSGGVFHPSTLIADCTGKVNPVGHATPGNNRSAKVFPVNEVTMSHNADTVSELDASLRNMRKVPIVEILVTDTRQLHEDDSVSTLGTPRVFEQLDKLLSEPRRLHQEAPPINNPLEDDANMGGSAAPPPMVTSHDAKALIDQLDSRTFDGDASSATGSAVDAVHVCNIASNWCISDNKTLLTKTSTRNDTPMKRQDHFFGSQEESIDSDESSVDEEVSQDETSTSAYNLVIDNAIRKAEMQIATNHVEQQKVEGKADLNSQSKERRSGFDSFMNLAASKLDKIVKGDDDHDKRRNKSHSNEYIDSPRQHKYRNSNEMNPKAINGNLDQLKSMEHFSDSQFDLLEAPVDSAGKNLNKIFIPKKNGRSTKRLMEQNAEDYSKNIKKPSKHHLDKVIMDQGRFLLEKDDAYWDTLSTIASTANERSSENDEYMDEILRPGPIPGEITTSGSELKSVHMTEHDSCDVKELKGLVGKGGRAVHQEPCDSEQGSFRSPINLDDMMNDVTDLIDAELLDTLPPTHPKRPPRRKMESMVTSQQRPCPETTMRRRENEEEKSGSLAIAASQIAKGIRSVSWGFEEIFEDKNHHSSHSERLSGNLEGTCSSAKRMQPNPEGMPKSSRKPLNTSETKPKSAFEDDLLSRTLDLSKGLLETIMGSQVVQEQERKNEIVARTLLDNPVRYDNRSNPDEGLTSNESRDDSHHEQERRKSKHETDLSPGIQRKLQSLRMQRSQALEKFRLSQISNIKNRRRPEPTRRTHDGGKRDRDRLKYYTVNHEYGKPLRGTNTGLSRTRDYPVGREQVCTADTPDIELRYTSSESNASTTTTPSQKARDLRLQLDEAMKASRDIQMSHKQLGSELNTFKQRYYRNSLAAGV